MPPRGPPRAASARQALAELDRLLAADAARTVDARADLYVMPSVSEPFGLTALVGVIVGVAWIGVSRIPPREKRPPWSDFERATATAPERFIKRSRAVDMSTGDPSRRTSALRKSTCTGPNAYESDAFAAIVRARRSSAPTTPRNLPRLLRPGSPARCRRPRRRSSPHCGSPRRWRAAPTVGEWRISTAP